MVGWRHRIQALWRDAGKALARASSREAAPRLLYLHVAGATDTTTLQPTDLTLLGMASSQKNMARSLPALSLESFQDVLNATPWAQTLVFHGWIDPLINPFTLAMVHLAAQKRPSLMTVLHTNIFQLKNRFSDVMDSPINTLIVHLGGHRPAAFADLTGLPVARFSDVEATLNKLMRHVRDRRYQFKEETDAKDPSPHVKRLLPQKLAQRLPALRVEISMTLDLTWVKEIHDIIAWADALGVDGLRFENHPAPERQLVSGSSQTEHQAAEALLLSIEAITPPHLQIALPRLPDHSGVSLKPSCSDVFHRVTVDSSLAVSACSERSLFQGKMGQLGERSFWQNRLFSWLRQAHSSDHPFTAPSSCATCPRGNPAGRRLLNASTVDWLPLVELD